MVLEVVLLPHEHALRRLEQKRLVNERLQGLDVAREHREPELLFTVLDRRAGHRAMRPHQSDRRGCGLSRQDDRLPERERHARRRGKCAFRGRPRRCTRRIMPDKTNPAAASSGHGICHLPYVDVEAYNAELRDEEGFVGDRASNRAFRALLEDLREQLRTSTGEDPIGDEASEEISKKTLDKILTKGDPEAAGVVHGVIEGFANELATVTKRFLRLKAWKQVERIAVGGGLRASRVGELAIGRASVLVKEAGHTLNLVPIAHDPDHAGLIGSVHLAPTWMFQGFDGVLAIDIGGSNIRVGIVGLGTKKTIDLADCEVTKALLWRHRDEKPKPTRENALAGSKPCASRRRTFAA